MSIHLSIDEKDIIMSLHNRSIPLANAALAVVMVTREHARPERELSHIIRQYEYIGDARTADTAIGNLKRIGWLTEVESYGQHLMQQAPDLRDKIAATIGDPAIADRLLAMRSNFEPNIRIVGPMNDSHVYSTYSDLIRSAQSEICLPMLATTPDLSSVPLLQDRARNGVQVRILLGAPNVVVKLRGESMRQAAEDSIHGWKKNAREARNIHIRLAHSVDDMLIATCMSIDRRILRFDVYDPERQRSLEGIMLEVNPPNGLVFNLNKIFQKHFDDSWDRAEPLRWSGKIEWYLGKSWQLLLVALFVGLAKWKETDLVLSGFFISLAASFALNCLVFAWSFIRPFVRR
jgi:hypothetical protein